MRRFRWWSQNLHPFWSLGFEVYRHPPMFSRGSGPEYGGYLYLGPWRLHASYSKPIDIDRLRRLTPPTISRKETS